MTFDPAEFLNATTSESNDTTMLPPPDNMSGDGYQILADKVNVRAWQGKADPSKSGLTLDIQWLIEDESVKAFCGREKVTCRQGIMLDLTDSGQLDMSKGRNIALGKLREALDLNTPGKPFSFSMIQGRMAKGWVQHRVDGENIYAEIKRVGKF
jgi:hypothetical protein